MESSSALLPVKKKLKSKIVGTRQNSLHTATENGQIDAIKTILSRGFSVNAVDKLNKTALHVAASKGYVNIVKLLLEEKADINGKDYKGRTPLHFAIQNGDLEIVKMILKAPPINGKPTDINSPTFLRETPLFLAALNGHIKVVKYLIRRGAKDCEIHDLGSALNVASAAGHLDIVKVLLDAGSDVTSYITKNDFGITPLHCAVLERRYFGGKKQFHFSYPSKLNKQQILKQGKVIDALIKAGSIIDDYDDDGVWLSVLHFALGENNTLFLKKLIDHGAHVDAHCYHRMTLLQHAAELGSHNAIRVLLEAGANIHEEDGYCELAPIVWAAKGRKQKVFSMLIRAGADIHWRSIEGDTLIAYCLRCGVFEISLYYSLFEYGVDMNSPNVDGDTAIHFLCRNPYKYYFEDFSIFFDRFLDFNIENESGLTPLECVRISNTEFAVKAMVLMNSSHNLEISGQHNELLIERNYQYFYQRCKAELEDLRQKKVWEWLSFYDLLIKPIPKLIEYCMNQELVRILDSGVCGEFTIYGVSIESRMRFARKRKILLETSLQKLSHLIKPIRLPRYVGLHIISYLTSCEIDNLAETELK